MHFFLLQGDQSRGNRNSSDDPGQVVPPPPGRSETVRLVRRPLFSLLYQPRMTDDECGAVDEMIIGRENRSTRRKPVAVPSCPPQNPT
jgi:hypothetical protein